MKNLWLMFRISASMSGPPLTFPEERLPPKGRGILLPLPLGEGWGEGLGEALTKGKGNNFIFCICNVILALVLDMSQTCKKSVSIELHRDVLRDTRSFL